MAGAGYNFGLWNRSLKLGFRFHRHSCWENELHKYDDGFQPSMDQMLLKLEAEILDPWSWSLNIVFQLYSPDQNQQHFNL